MRNSFLAYASAFGITAWSVGSFSQQLRVGPVYADKPPSVSVVIETPSNGAPNPPPLKPGDLTLIEDGKPLGSATAIKPFKEVARGISVVLVLDVSGTMAGQPIADMKNALASFVERAGPKDQIALVTIADDVSVEASFSANREALKNAIEGLSPRGRITELFKGIFKALSLLEQQGLPERKRLFVISDGKDEGTAYTLDDVIKKAGGQRVPVDAIGLTQVDPKYLSGLERMADLTGGCYAHAARSEDLEALCQRGITAIEESPVATFAPSLAKWDGQPHAIGVRIAGQGRMLEDHTDVVLPEYSHPPEPKKIPLWLIAAAALLVLALAGCIVAVVIMRRKRLAREEVLADKMREAALAAQRAREEAQAEAARNEAAKSKAATHLENQALPQSGQQGDGATATEDILSRPPRKPPARKSQKTQIRQEFPIPRPGSPCAWLTVADGPVPGQRFPIESDTTWIGADAGNAVVIEGDQFLSSHHACIRFHSGSLLLYNNKSTNGTSLDGEIVAEVPKPLTIGARIKLGRTVFVLVGA